jgi:hypothetical protein
MNKISLFAAASVIAVVTSVLFGASLSQAILIVVAIATTAGAFFVGRLLYLGNSVPILSDRRKILAMMFVNSAAIIVFWIFVMSTLAAVCQTFGWDIPNIPTPVGIVATLTVVTGLIWPLLNYKDK